MKTYSKVAISFALLGAFNAQAGSKYHRLIWDNAPQSQATIGFTPDGSTNHYVKYGVSTDESLWQRKNVTASHTFDGSLQSKFVKLTGLSANKAVYYRVCDDSGCGQRLWFKTAPNDNSPFVAIAGGDTRTGWTNRQNGNKLVAKIRPLFIMHGGDYTNANTASEMSSYLNDWQLTFSSDSIDGLSYKRIYPFVATHGNHEDDNYKTLCQVFGVDYDNNNVCDAKDTYGAFNVSPLLRVYTLNSQYKNSGWSSYATAMNNWLQQDLQSSGGSASWRVVQYHKPMFPHYSGKSDNTILHTWWANHFYNHKMNLVVESDTHINKVTQALKPDGNNFISTTNGGTVFVGEGSWGAPARSANDPKSWTIDLASIQQFKVLTVSSDKLDVRTAQFNSTANTLSKADRDANPTLLPNNVNWWYASGAGDVLNLVKATNGLTKIDTGVIDPPVGDTELTSGVAAANISGSKSQELGFYIDVPAGQNALLFEMSGGTGDADMYVRYGSKPTSSTYDCRPYKNGNNETCSIDAVKTGKYYVVVKGYSAFSGVSLKATYSNNGGGGNGGSDTFTNLSASADKWQYRSATIPAGVSQLVVSISGGTGDADLYVKSGSAPNSSSYECRPYKSGNSETCTITNPKAGEWHFGVKAYKAYSGVTLSYSYE